MSGETFLNGRVTLHCGDSRGVLKTIPDSSIDSIVTDPPYALVSIVKRFANSPRSERTENTENPYGRTGRGFMGQKWDNGETAFAVDFWKECLRVLKPGGHVVAFSGTRTYHRMACAIEDAGFEVRDMLSWLYGSGFPKSHNVAVGINKAAGVVGHRAKRFNTAGGETATIRRQELRSDHADYVPYVPDNDWSGWGTALKPACEPICFGRKPLSGTVARNVLDHGTGAINIDSCRVGSDTRSRSTGEKISENLSMVGGNYSREIIGAVEGRWPANVLHDGSSEVFAAFPEIVDEESAARFFYTAKADASDRIGSKHPTVKPVDLMQWLCRLVTPPGGTVLDPFSGTGTTGEAAFREGFNAVLIEREEEYQADIRRRMGLVLSGPDERARESIKARAAGQPIDAGPLFGGLDTPPRGGGGSTECSRTNNRTDRNEAVKA